MNIMIVGCGRVGSQLALLLANEGHNVTILDKSADSFKRLGGIFNGITATGNGFDEQLLRELKIERQDAFVAVTSGDNTNLMASQIAKKMFKVPRVIARVYDPSRATIYKNFDLDIISGTVLVAAMIRDKLIENRFSSYLIESGDLGVIEIRGDEGLTGKRIDEVNMPGEFIVVAIERDKRVFIPKLSEVILLHDKIMGVVTVDHLGAVKKHFKIA